MNCLCGCGTRLDRDLIELNLMAGEVAIELVVWDKARALRSPVAAAEIEAIIAAGAPRYQDLLAALHTGSEPGEVRMEAIREWLEHSRGTRLRLADRLPAVPKRKIKLSAGEQERIDRVHPERTFSGAPAKATEPAAGEEAADAAVLEALLVVALEDVRAGQAEEAMRTLRRFLSERS